MLTLEIYVRTETENWQWLKHSFENFVIDLGFFIELVLKLKEFENLNPVFDISTVLWTISGL